MTTEPQTAAGRALDADVAIERLEAWAGSVLRLIKVAPTEAVINETGIVYRAHSTPPERAAIRAEARQVVASWLERDIAVIASSGEAAPVDGLREVAHKAAQIGFTYGALGRDYEYVHKNVQDMLREEADDGR